MIQVGNAPCSWGVEFAGDPRNPQWRDVLRENAEAGYTGIELGPVGFMPEDPIELGEALAEFKQELIGGVVFRPFHDPDQWDDVLDGSERTIKALNAHGAKHLVLIDSISPRRAPTAGRWDAAEKMDLGEWTAYRDRIAHVAKMGTDAGLTVGIHAHAAGFMDFEPELDRLLDEVPEDHPSRQLRLRECTRCGKVRVLPRYQCGEMARFECSLSEDNRYNSCERPEWVPRCG